MEEYLLRGTDACKVVRSLSGRDWVRTDLPHPLGSQEALKGHRLTDSEGKAGSSKALRAESMVFSILLSCLPSTLKALFVCCFILF